MASTFTWAFAPVGICPFTSRAMMPTSPCIVIDVAGQRDVAIAADVDRVVGVAGAHEAQRDLLRGRHVESEEFLLLLLDHLRQRGGLGAQPAAATGVRAIIAHDDAGVELACLPSGPVMVPWESSTSFCVPLPSIVVGNSASFSLPLALSCAFSASGTEFTPS
ncbi:hypothetical protein G6F35_015911 [Rhizopus arrhizus]|nr:hypothetical protein G6F35_015911 [Rhizopus arrhizus]